jgi:Zn-dependent peptidase ImmA (M78 family)
MRTTPTVTNPVKQEGSNSTALLSLESNKKPFVSLLSELRSVTPTRSLGLAEAMRVAELQANKLREHLDLDELAISDDAITRQRRIRVVLDDALGDSASGSTHWDGTTWTIILNPSESAARRRFSLFHEYKHIIDDCFRTFLYQDEKHISAARKAEQVADYFAACALMTKRLVKRVFCSGTTRLDDLAGLFDVSEIAMTIRLDAIGLQARPTASIRHALTNTYRRAIGQHQHGRSTA